MVHGTARRNLMVMEEKLANIDVPQPKTPSSIELKTKTTVPPPDLELCIELDRHDGCTLYFTLHSTLEAIGYHQAKFGQVTLKGSPLEQMQQLVYQEMSSLAAPVKQAEKDLAERRMATLGNELWDELIPNKLKQEYWRFKSLVKTILITSDEPWVPWELIKPYRYNDNGEREDDPFLCQQFAISRWLSGPGTVDELLVGAARPVAPIKVNLRSVQEEVSFIKHLSDLYPQIIPLEPFSDCMSVLQWLENAEFSMLHFACHGMFDATTPDNSAIMLSGNPLRPSDIRARFGGRRPRPLLFINACHGARTGFSFTGLGGWASRLVEARVGAFVGAMWEVDDELALRFAQRFYTRLLKDNQTIAEAFRQAREEIRQLAPYNSTWLAYALYADPLGRFKGFSPDNKHGSTICKTDLNGINSSYVISSARSIDLNHKSWKVKNTQNTKGLKFKWWIKYIIAPLIGILIIHVITAIINAPPNKSPQLKPFPSVQPNTSVR